MHTQIDWLSFTMAHNALPDGAGEELFDAVQTLEQKWLPSSIREWMASFKWEAGKGRAPYSYRVACQEGGCSIYFGGELTHTLYEFSGVGCAALRHADLETEVLRVVAHRATRLDIASDIDAEISPSSFVSSGFAGRMKSRGSFVSETGQTEYIGSQKSERYARVYKYAPPHPRANLLRIEHVLRRDYAKQAVEWIIAYGVNYVQKQIGEAFGWQHPLWQPTEAAVEPLRVPRGSRDQNGTLRWLIKAAAPAFKKLVQAGLIEDPEQFVKQVFLDQLDEDKQLPLELFSTVKSFEEE
jgi:hypothetical protein